MHLTARMMRLKPASSLQKTYDECYLICSTAVYFEGQNNEDEALRSWRSALETIYYHNAYRVPSNYTPKNETEKALQDSIRDLELQCRERVDLLSALRESRKEVQDQEGGDGSGSGKEESLKGKNAIKTNAPTTPGWIGDGTIPPVDYTDLSKPAPLRGTLSSNGSQSTLNDDARSSSSTVTGSGSRTIRAHSNSSGRNMSRGQSPERRLQMLTTLRNNKNNKDQKKYSHSSGESRKTDIPPKPMDLRPAASKAAGLAWDSRYRHPSSEKTASDTVIASSLQRTSSDSGRRKDSFDERSRSFRPESTEGAANLSGNQRGREPERSAKVYRRSPAATMPLRESDRRERSSSSLPLSGSKDLSRSAESPEPSTRPRLEASRPSYSYATKPSLHSSGRETNLRPETETSRKPKPSGKTKKFSRSNAVASTSSRAMRHRSPNSTLRVDDDLDRTAPNMISSREAKTHDVNRRKKLPKHKVTPPSSDQDSSDHRMTDEDKDDHDSEDDAVFDILKKLPKGIDVTAARQILNDIIVRGDEVHWDDIAGLEAAKKALKEAVVYPFLRPDLFSGLREPARGMLLFGPPGTGKTMLARAVATESKSTFFSVSASTLTSKWHGESEKLVRALFGLSKALAPSIIFVDEIDSLLSARSSGTENEASRRSKTEFLIQWSDLQRAAAGRERNDGDKDKKKGGGDASRVLVLAATNMPWDIDEAARRRFVRRQYIPLPEHHVREQQLRKLLSYQKHELSDEDISQLVLATEGFSGSDITALAKDAAMGPLRNLGEALLHTPKEQIRPIRSQDFEASLSSIRPSVSRDGLRVYEEWAEKFGERGG